jgi:AraC-like DNA-binding protein
MRLVFLATSLVLLLTACASEPPAVARRSPDQAIADAEAARTAGRYQAALDAYFDAAQQGDNRGKIGLGTMYYAGTGAVRDYGEAVHWLTAPAEAGEPIAQLTLGRILDAGGTGVLQDLAELVGMSQSHFSHAFKASTGLPPHQWQLQARIRKGQDLLLRGDRSLTEVAPRTGHCRPAPAGAGLALIVLRLRAGPMATHRSESGWRG